MHCETRFRSAPPLTWGEHPRIDPRLLLVIARWSPLALLALLAAHTQGGGRERGQPRRRDRVRARFAPAVPALVQPLQRALHLEDALPDGFRERELLFAGQRLGTDVGDVVTGYRNQAVGRELGRLDHDFVVLSAQFAEALLQRGPDVLVAFKLGGRPGDGTRRAATGGAGARRLAYRGGLCVGLSQHLWLPCWKVVRWLAGRVPAASPAETANGTLKAPVCSVCG